MTNRVLSIQSHVVHGYVGNKAAVFPLQLLGLEVDVINSVHFSNHTGYTKGWKGTVMDGTQLQSIIEGLEQNELLDDVRYVLTGYIGSASFLSAIRSLVLKIRGDKPDFRYLCDPVLGDNGELYVPAELVSLFKTEIIPLADIVTPNQFEVEQLTGITIQGIADAKRACSCFHDMGPSIVFLTSLELTAEELGKRKRVEGIDIDTELITVFASQRHQKNGKPVDECFVIDCPKLPGSYTGTGDLTAALILGHLDKHPDNLSLVMEKVVNTMQVVIQRTNRGINASSSPASAKARELQLVQSKQDIESPPSTYLAVKVD